MIRHYLTFAHQARILDRRLNGWTLAECWSQERNRLALRFVLDRQSLFVEISVDLHLGYVLLRDELPRARKNTIDFFGSLLGARLEGVDIHDGERLVTFRFADGRALAVFFFGPGGGNALLLEGDSVVDSFRRYGGEYDAILRDESDGDLVGRREIVEAVRAAELPAVKALLRAIPGLGRRLAVEALLGAGLEEGASLADLPESRVEDLLAHADRLYEACHDSERFYLYRTLEEVVFALTPLERVEQVAEQVERFDDIAEAVRAYRSTSFRGRRIGEIRARLARRLVGERNRLERAESKRLADAVHNDRADEWERNGSILLAHLNDIPKGADRVALPDWEGEVREISLNPKLTGVENAERYFKRARGAREAAVQAVERGERNRRARREMERLSAEVERAATVGELERLEAEHPEIFKMTGEAKEQGSAERFRRFEVAGGHEVYAGKSAANNDELTVRFARQNDYWFHARGTSGSHVVLRWNDAKSKPPKEVLRQAASIAAYYSGAKNAKMVPVAYTLKKYVRKPKGAAVGAVVMEREEVVMVEPKLPE